MGRPSVAAAEPVRPRPSRQPLRIAVLVGATAIAVLACSVLAGVLLGVDVLTNWSASKTTAPGVAVALLLVAVGTAFPRTARYAAVVVLLIGVRGVASYLVEMHPVALWPDGVGEYRIALVTAVSLVLLGVAMFLGPSHRVVTELTAAAVVFGAGVGLLGYLYDVNRLYAVGPTGSIMAPPTAVMLILTSLVLLASVPRGFATWVVHGRDAGAVLLRQQLPIVHLVVPLVGWLVILGRREGWYDAGLATALFAATAMVLLGATAYYTAGLLSRIDERRQRALTALTWINADLTERIQARAEELEAARSRSEVFDDRQRIAADMHDHVIQVLFAVALNLNASAGTEDQPQAMRRAATGIDEAIKELRSSIYELKHPVTSSNLATRLERVVESVGRARTNLSLTFTGEGSLDGISDLTAEHLVAAARELVSNAVRHARATSVDVEVALHEHELVLTVADDGRGFEPESTRPSGLHNVRTRAERLGGGCTWVTREGGGTVATWRAPTHPPPHEVREPMPGPGTEMSPALTDAVAGCARALATRPPDKVLDEVAAVTAALFEADHVAVCLAAPDEQLRIVLATGLPPTSGAVGMHISRESTMSGYVLLTGAPLRVADLSELPATLRLFGRLPFGPGLMVPVGDPAFATLVLARSHGRPQFTHEDIGRALVLARFFDLALELAGDLPPAEALPDGTARQGRTPATA